VSSIWCEVLLLFSAVAVIVLVVADEQQIGWMIPYIHSLGIHCCKQ
jgi:hypothetical protein